MESQMKKIIVLFCALAIGFLASGKTLAVSPPEKLVRVAVLKEIKAFNLSVKGAFKILDSATGQVLSQESVLRTAKVGIGEKGIIVGGKVFLPSRIKFSPLKDATIYVNDRRLRGEVDIVKNSNGLLTVVNILDLENYIKGVLYHEVSHYWPLEAIKAQAVAARTYALYEIGVNKTKDYDVTNDIYSQVYGGRNSERYRTNVAVDRTRGLILVYREKIVPAYYSATCAGFTEDANELWKENLPPLKGVKCDYCLHSPHYRWKKNFRLKDIQDKLNENGFKLGFIKEVRVVERNASNRIRTLEITTRDDKSVTISGKDFRNMIGPNLIRSNNYEIEMKGYYMDLVGKGWGHGVGLCQWGAAEMSRRGFNFKEILNYYYPGADIVSDETAGF